MPRSSHALLMAVAVLVVLAACNKEELIGGPSTATPYTLAIPGNFPPMPIPADNPMTVEGVRLGRYLFYEERLSANDHMSCATCHSHSTAFTDGVSTSTGVDGTQGTRNAMSLVNPGYQHFFFWDGRASSLEQQALQPVTNPIEMHETWPHVVAKLQADPAYVRLFQEAFGRSTIDSSLVAKALAQFMRTLISGNSAYDKWKRGEDTLSAQALAGYQLFTTEAGNVGQVYTLPGTGATVIGQGGADCFHCHTEGLFTDSQFHNNALDPMPLDSGRADVTRSPMDLGKFKVPTLRNVLLSHPYMHDGRFGSIQQVFNHYDEGGAASPTADPLMKFTDPGLTMGLTAEKRAQLLAFIDALADYDFINNPEFLDPGEPQ